MRLKGITRTCALAYAIVVSLWHLSVPEPAAAKVQPAIPVKITKTAELDQLLAAGKLQLAGKRCTEMLDRSPQDARLHLWYGNYLRTTGQLENAIREYEETVALDPRYAEPRACLAEIYLKYLDIENGLRYAREALSLDPVSSRARIVLVSALLQKDQLSEAERHVAGLLKQEAANPEVLLLAYQLKAKKADYDKAYTYLRTALSISPANLDWQLEMALLLERMGDRDGACRWLENLLAAQPGCLAARLRLARLLEVKSQDFDEAIYQYELALACDPNSAAAATGRERCLSKKQNIALRLRMAIRSWWQNITSPARPR